jgi:AcrR family transcriptional regulator
MGRRGEHSFEQLQSLVLEAARDIVYGEGVGALSTRKIAKKIGYSVSSLYSVFSNFDEIILHLNVSTLDDLINFIQQAIKQPGNTLKIIAHAYLNFKSMNEYAWSLLFEYPMNHLTPSWYNAKIRQLFEVVRDFVNGHSHSDHAHLSDQHIAILWAAIHGICLLDSKGKFSKINISQDAHTLVDILIESFTVCIEAKN